MALSDLELRNEKGRLAGWHASDYLQRTWDCVHDDLNATAMVISDELRHSAALLALDLYI